MKYYVKNHAGKVSGPFPGADLKKMLAEKKLDLSWQISADRVKWCVAAKVKNLSTGLETALEDHFASGNQYRPFTPQEVVTLFLDKFVLNNENFKDSFPWLQTVRKWWARLTMPKDFVITEVTAAGVHHVKYNVGTGDAKEIDQKEAAKKVSAGVKQVNWFLPLAVVLGLVWGCWTLKDFVTNFSPTFQTFKTMLFLGIGVYGFIIKTKQTKVFVGYTLDEAAAERLTEIAETLSVLRKCSQVWIYQVQQSEGRLDWKYNAGETFQVARLPMAIFNRTIPNVETNVRVSGITYRSQAIYFLPEKMLVIDGDGVDEVPYPELNVAVDTLEYVEMEGHVYGDSQVTGRRWRYINRDGSPDRRFKSNVEYPVVRCGILALGVGQIRMKMMTTNPKTPEVVKEKLNKLKLPLCATSATPVSTPSKLKVDVKVVHEDVTLRRPPKPKTTPTGTNRGLPDRLKDNPLTVTSATTPARTPPRTPPASAALPTSSLKGCPFCGEQVLAHVKKCKHCGEILDAALRAAHEPRVALVAAGKEVATSAEPRPTSKAVPTSPTTLTRTLVTHALVAVVIVSAFLLGVIVVGRRGEPNPNVGPTTKQDHKPDPQQPPRGK